MLGEVFQLSNFHCQLEFMKPYITFHYLLHLAHLLSISPVDGQFLIRVVSHINSMSNEIYISFLQVVRLTFDMHVTSSTHHEEHAWPIHFRNNLHLSLFQIGSEHVEFTRRWRILQRLTQ